MKAVEIQGGFGLDHLARTDRPDPVPGPGEVLVAMHAASLNYRDLLTVRGEYNPKQPLPLVPLSDGVGHILVVGPGVTRVKVGDRVAPLFVQKWRSGLPDRAELASTLGGPLDGVLRERAVFSEESVAAVPAHLTDEEAATLPCAALTAWSALVTQGAVKQRDTVVVQGTGGVSLFGLQFAKLLGARVIATSSSDEKLARVLELGADEVVNYRTHPEWSKVVREHTAGLGADHVIDVGGAETLAQSIAAVRPGGTVCVVGNLSGNTASISVIPILMRNLHIQGVFVGHREGFEAMCRAISAHQLKPVIARVFEFDATREAFEAMSTGGTFGKICIRIAP